jgi:iron complex outermembrane recepter protein
MKQAPFYASPLLRAISLAGKNSKRILNPFKQTAAILAASTLAFTPNTTLAAESALEEIIVTATRRAESVQDVAIPITAVTGDMLERRFAQDLRDLSNSSPNVLLEPVGIFQNSSSFSIRGQGSGCSEGFNRTQRYG